MKQYNFPIEKSTTIIFIEVSKNSHLKKSARRTLNDNINENVKKHVHSTSFEDLLNEGKSMI